MTSSTTPLAITHTSFGREFYKMLFQMRFYLASESKMSSVFFYRSSSNVPRPRAATNVPDPVTQVGTAVTTSTPTTAQASDSIMSAPSRSQSAPPLLADTPSHASKRRRRQEAASPSPDPVEQGILDQLANLISIMRPQPSRDESDNIGSMVACQHRTLNPEQKRVFVNGITQAYVTALQYDSLYLFQAATGSSDERVYQQL